MANLKELRRRISGIQNTRQLTRAMKLVAAAKLRKAQERVENQRQYARTLEKISRKVAGSAKEANHPLLAQRDPGRALVLVLTSDKGLCGSFNSNVLKGMEAFERNELKDVKEISYLAVGRKAHEYMLRTGKTIEHYYEDILDDFDQGSALDVARKISEHYSSADYDAVWVIFNEFKSAILQRKKTMQLLPISIEESAEDSSTEHIFEPDTAQILDRLLPKYLLTVIQGAFLESIASETGARMTAMDSATNNAGELIDKLSLKYNKARQEAITTDLMDIVGGAEALNS